MKTKFLYFSMIAFFTMLFFSSCEKEETAEPNPTSLELSLKDGAGNIVAGASVKLYSSQTDLANSTNQVGTTQTSDATGKVKFSGLSAIKYYWFASKDCQNNANGSFTTTTNLTSNVTNTANVILTSTGTIRFVNNSSNPYEIFINGSSQGEMVGGSTADFIYMPIGSYSFRVLQKSGYAVYPTDETYNGDLTCGGALTVSFPLN